MALQKREEFLATKPTVKDNGTYDINEVVKWAWKAERRGMALAETAGLLNVETHRLVFFMNRHKDGYNRYKGQQNV